VTVAMFINTKEEYAGNFMALSGDILNPPIESE
jgi:hypothetical protein